MIQREADSEMRAFLTVLPDEHHEEARRSHNAMMCLISSLGRSPRKYRREATQRMRAIVAEVYSSPRVTALARRSPRLGIIPGLALDLTGTDEDG